MSYAIVGFGKIGQALAHAFARKSIDVTVASRRPPEALAPQARAIGPTVVAKSLRDALDADTIILAVPFMMLLLIVGRAGRPKRWRRRLGRLDPRSSPSRYGMHSMPTQSSWRSRS
jgi:prephenate dehydrogenase